jgi:DNA-binding transcriptional regulator GbsR (MarR family)
MSAEARDLRDLARKLDEVCKAHHASSMAYEMVRALTDQLCLRARVMELEHRLDHDRAEAARSVTGWPEERLERTAAR